MKDGQKSYLVGKDRVGLNELLGKSVVDVFEDVGTHSTAGAASDGVAHDETFQRVRVVCLPIDDVEQLLLRSSG